MIEFHTIRMSMYSHASLSIGPVDFILSTWRQRDLPRRFRFSVWIGHRRFTIGELD